MFYMTFICTNITIKNLLGFILINITIKRTIWKLTLKSKEATPNKGGIYPHFATTKNPFPQI